MDVLLSGSAIAARKTNIPIAARRHFAPAGTVSSLRMNGGIDFNGAGRPSLIRPLKGRQRRL
jgi:hypothetical protein